MKYLGLILVVALVTGQVLTARINENDGSLEYLRQSRGTNEKFKDFLEVKARKMLREGDTKLDVPVMDPYVNELFDYVLEEDEISGKIQLRDLEVNSAANYTVKNAVIAIFPQKKVSLALRWPEIHGKGLYKVDAVVAKDVQVNGVGKFQFELTDLYYETVAYVSFNGGMKITKMETKISLGGLQFEATGLFGDEELSKYFSELISDMVPDLVNEYQEDLVQLVDKIVMDTVSEKFKGKSLKDILEILG